MEAGSAFCPVPLLYLPILIDNDDNERQSRQPPTAEGIQTHHTSQADEPTTISLSMGRFEQNVPERLFHIKLDLQQRKVWVVPFWIHAHQF
jgi:hypothetical protein